MNYRYSVPAHKMMASRPNHNLSMFTSGLIAGALGGGMVGVIITLAFIDLTGGI